MFVDRKYYTRMSMCASVAILQMPTSRNGHKQKYISVERCMLQWLSKRFYLFNPNRRLSSNSEMLESSHAWTPEADKVDFLLPFHDILGETQ